MLRKITFWFLFTIITSVYSQDKQVEFGKVTIEELKEEFYPLDSTAHAAYLYKENTLSYTRQPKGWFQNKSVYEKIKIYDEEGFDMAVKKISYYTSENGSKERVSKIKAYTYFLENNQIKKVELNKKEIFEIDNGERWKQKKFAMPNIQKGVIVEWMYKITSPFALYIDKLRLQSDVPIKKYSSVLVMPEYFVFKLYKTGKLPVKINILSKRMNGLVGKQNFYIIEADSVPAFEEEIYMSNRDNFISSMNFDLSHVKYPGSERKYHAIGNWDEVAKRVFKTHFFAKNLKKKKYFEEDFLTLDLEEKSDKEKIAIILAHVKSKIKWNEVYKYGVSTDKGVKKAYTLGEGNAADINLVLTAMLKKAGFKASPVMLSTRDHGIALFPSMKAYNYIITAVEGVDEQPILLDATEKYSYLNVLPFRDINWYGRLIREDLTSQEIYLNPLVYSLEVQQMHFSIQEDLRVKGALTTKYTTQNALYYRKKTNHLNENSHKEYLQKKYDVEVKVLKNSSENKLNKPITRFINFNKEGAVEKINKKLYLSPLLFLATKNSPFKLEERDYPVDFGFPWKDVYKVSIEVPKGYKVDYLPEDGEFKMADDIGSYLYTITRMGDLINISFSIQINTGVITPNYYKELKELYKKMILKQSEKIVFIKK